MTERDGGRDGAETEQVVEQVRERYGRIARGLESGCCGSGSTACAPPETAVGLGIGYRPEDLGQVPQEANLGLGCGAPVGLLELRPGESVLDLGSGPGLDALLAARSVGPTGRVVGVDMTPSMLERARANAAKAGLRNVEFREGRLERLPLDDASFDAVTSNCVINLVPDKGAVFSEVARVLRPGGRLVISDIVLREPLPPAIARDILAYVGCVSGAMLETEYFSLVSSAGLGEVEILRDVDYLATLLEVAPDEVRRLAELAGVDVRGLLGRVRSITFRAAKP